MDSGEWRRLLLYAHSVRHLTYRHEYGVPAIQAMEDELGWRVFRIIRLAYKMFHQVRRGREDFQVWISATFLQQLCDIPSDAHQSVLTPGAPAAT
jgi:hypothetical protein